MTTEQMIEEALKEFEREFIDKVQIGEDEYDVALKDKPQDMFDFLKKQLTTIATKSTEEERKRIGDIMYRFEDINRESGDLVGGWSWLKNELFNTKEKS